MTQKHIIYNNYYIIMEFPNNMDAATKQRIWNTCYALEDYSDYPWKEDFFGNIINYEDYLNKNSKYRWEIEDIDDSDPEYFSDNVDMLRSISFRTKAIMQTILEKKLGT